MSFDPLWKESLFVITHTFAAFFALIAGFVQFVGVKGTTMHRVLGWGWVISMLVVAASSFWIHGMKQFGNFSWIHILSIVVLINVPLAVLAARKHNIQAHKYTMAGVFFGGVIIAGTFTLVPGRVMYEVVFGG